MVGMQNGAATLGDNLGASYKKKRTLMVGPTIASLGVSPKELRTYVHTKTHTQVFIPTRFIAARLGKSPAVLQEVHEETCGVCRKRNIIPR